MPIDKSILEQYVVTANSGKYGTWEEINSKFPELKDYDPKVLEEYVVTANSGKYGTWDEINSKFPEFFTEKKKAKSRLPYFTRCFWRFVAWATDAEIITSNQHITKYGQTITQVTLRYKTRKTDINGRKYFYPNKD